jgi:hypothetical protein
MKIYQYGTKAKRRGIIFERRFVLWNIQQLENKKIT